MSVNLSLSYDYVLQHWYNIFHKEISSDAQLISTGTSSTTTFCSYALRMQIDKVAIWPQKHWRKAIVAHLENWVNNWPCNNANVKPVHIYFMETCALICEET